ncbi:hypothetical protein CONLIGDRAFT_637325 [Coniochaeta ligniaria NRRL 30616]|uniref:Uncharacterized protein n=1 Tax=Coniochaeta ligniaria NRRL 30616 TaxID=1408157 RepID=A0A1J7I9E3_9PEZI|nr:hypothetical protein CONLIGDRAFT_637325 [Coniochaeta ligniaria NRRL 30616]
MERTLRLYGSFLPASLMGRISFRRVYGKQNTGKSRLRSPGMQTAYDKNELGYLELNVDGFDGEASAMTASLVLITASHCQAGRHLRLLLLILLGQVWLEMYHYVMWL